jgi:hypothetical protein
VHGDKCAAKRRDNLGFAGNVPIFATTETWELAAANGYLLTAGHESQLEELHRKATSQGIGEPDVKEMETAG